MEYIDSVIEKAKILKKEYDQNEILLSYNEIQGDTGYFRSLVERQTEIKNICISYDRFTQSLKEIDSLNKLIESEQDIELKNFYREEILLINDKCNNEYLIMKLGMIEKNIISEVIVEIYSKNTDFLQKILIMYTSYCKKNDLNCSIIYNENHSLNLKIKGNLAYERFSAEGGIHQVREAGSAFEFRVLCYRSHTQKSKILENEIRIDVFRSSGAGGQNINKLSTAIRATHIPTNISVVCQDERSQRQNKEKAINNLTDKVNAYYSSLYEKERENERKNSKDNVVRIYDFVSGKVYQDKMTAEIDYIMKGNVNIFTDEILVREK